MMASDSELLVNVITPRLQTSHVIGTAIDINEQMHSAVVFSGKGLGDDKGVFLRAYGPGKEPSDVLLVNQTIREEQSQPSVALDGLGRSWIVWAGRGRDSRGLADQSGIFLSMFDSESRRLMPETLVNTTIGGVQSQPDIDVAPNGDLVVVWSGAGNGDSDGVFLQRFSAQGQRLGVEQRVNTYTVGEQSYPSLAIAGDGSFVVSWSSRHQDGEGWGVYYRRFAADGTPRGDEQLASHTRTGSQFRSRIGSDYAGNVAMVWAGYSTQNSWDVYLRMVDAQGQPRGSERVVNRDMRGHQQDADIAMAADGRFVVSWTSGQPNATGSQAGSGWEVFAKLYDAQGNEKSGDTSLSPHSGPNSGHQQFAAVALGPGPDWLASWSGAGAADRGGVWFQQPRTQLRPIFPQVPLIVAPEEQTLYFPLKAIPAWEGQKIGYRLDPTDHPDGMVIDPLQPRLIWTPTEADGPGTFQATVIAYDLEDPSSWTSQRMIFSILEVNRPPALVPIDSLVVDEGTLVSIPAQATDPDIPRNSLEYRLKHSSDPSMRLDPVSGVFEWRTQEYHASPQIPQQDYPVTVEVFDRNDPNSRAEVSFVITVREVDRLPEIESPLQWILDEGRAWQMQLQTRDPDDATASMQYRWVGQVPTGLTLDRDGTVRWIPSESQGPNTYWVDFEVSHPLQQSSATGRLTLQVREINEPPQLPFITDRHMVVGESLSIPIVATDEDVPTNRLQYQLIGSIHPGAGIDSSTGTFQFTPVEMGTYTFTVQVSDDGISHLSDQQSWTVWVGEGAVPLRLEPIPDQVIDEERAWSYPLQLVSTLPLDRIRFRLENAPEGVAVDPVHGNITWMPSESQGPARYVWDVIAYDTQGTVPAYRATMQVDVREVNRPPALLPWDRVRLMEQQRLLVSLTATDPDLPRNTLAWEMLDVLPMGMLWNPQTGSIDWTPQESDGPALLSLRVRVHDQGVPDRYDEQTLTIEVMERNEAPVLDPIPDQGIDEQILWTYSLRAQDVDEPRSRLRFGLDDAAKGLGIRIDEQTGVLQWTPTEAQGPSQHRIRVWVEEEGADSIRVERTFQLDVREVNRPPRLEPIQSVRAVPGEQVVLPLVMSDPDSPQQSLQVEFSPALPPQAVWDSVRREIRWNVPATMSSQVFPLRVTVRDDGVPSLMDFQESVIEVVQPRVELREDQRMITGYAYPIRLSEATRSLSIQIESLQFDAADSTSMNDALELSLVDLAGIPVAGVIAPNRDAFFNITEGLSPVLGRGTRWDPIAKKVTVDVGHLPSGKELRLIARLVNNDRDDLSRVVLSGTVESSSQGGTAAPTTLEDFAMDVASSPLPNLDTWLLHLEDVSAAMAIKHEHTTYDADTQWITTTIKLTNRADYPIRGPFLIAIENIDHAQVSVVDPSGWLPVQLSHRDARWPSRWNGAPYYRFEENSFGQAGKESTVVWLPEEERRLTVRFHNPTNDRFHFGIRTLGSMNTSPVFDEWGRKEARVDVDYELTLHAKDAEEDILQYAIMVAPQGMSIDRSTGVLKWKPTASQVGMHSIRAEVRDPYGGTDEIDYELMVLPNTPLNRPPRFVSTPIVDAFVGERYEYLHQAYDPDQDSLRYAIANGLPSAVLEPNASQGSVLAWTPLASDVDQLHPVTLEVDDGQGGKGEQTFAIYVHPSRDNLPPVIVTTPELQFAIPLQNRSSGFGPVEPKAWNDLVPRGSMLEREIAFTLPDDMQLPSADIVLVVDESGSMVEQAWVSTMIQNLDQELQRRGIGENRFAIVGYGAFDPKPRIVTQPPSLDALLYGPSGQLIERKTIPNGVESIAFATSLTGPHQVVLTRSRNASEDAGASGTNAVQFPEFKFFVESNETKPNALLSTGWGLHSGTLQAGIVREISFQANAGERAYIDGLDANKIAIEVIDPQGKIAYATDDYRKDLSPCTFARTGSYRLRLKSDVATDYSLRMVRPEEHAVELTWNERVIDTWGPSHETHFYRFHGSRGQLIWLDRWFETREGDLNSIAVDPTLFQIIAPDGSAIDLPSRSQQPERGETLDLPPISLLQDGEYVLAIRRGVDAEIAPMRAQFVLRDATSAPKHDQGEVVVIQGQHPSSTEVIRYDLRANEAFRLEATQWVGMGQFRLVDAWGHTIVAGAGRTGVLFSQVSILEDGAYYLFLESDANQSQLGSYTLRLTTDTAPPPLPSRGFTWDQLMEGTISVAEPMRLRLTVEAGETIQWFAQIESGRIRMRSPSGGILWEDVFEGGISKRNAPSIVHALQGGSYEIEAVSFIDGVKFAAKASRVPSSPLPRNALVEDSFTPSSAAKAYQWQAERGTTLELRIPKSDEAFAPSGLAASRALSLQVTGSAEDGYDGIDFAIDQLPFRSRVAKHMILVTDEDRDPLSSNSFESIRQELNAWNIGLHTIVRGEVAVDQQVVMGVAEDSSGWKGFVQREQGAFEVMRGDLVDWSQLEGTTRQDYIDLAMELDGTAWSIGKLRDRSSEQAAIRESFTSAFVNELAERIEDRVEIALRSTNALAPVTIGVPRMDTGKLIYPVRVMGDGDAWNVDFEFYNRLQANVVYGMVPASFAASYRYDVRAVDPDGDAIQYRWIQPFQERVLFDSLHGTMTWSPMETQSVTFRVMAMDAWGGTDTQTWTVDARQRLSNRNPLFDSLPNRSHPALQPMQISIQADDPDGDAVSYQLVADANRSWSIPTGMSIDAADGRVEWTPTRDQIGDHSIGVRVLDGKGGYAVQPLNISVTPPILRPSGRPVITSVPIDRIGSRERYRYQVQANDPNLDPLEYSLAVAPSGMTIDREKGTIVWPTKDVDVGIHEVIVRVTDATGLVAVQAYRLVVVQSPPLQITSQPKTRLPWQSLYEYVPAASSRIANETYRWEILEGPIGASIDATGKVVWRADTLGLHSWLLQVTGVESQETTTQRWNVLVDDESINHPPTIEGLPRTRIRVDLPWIWKVPAHDEDRDPLTFSLDRAPSGMTLDSQGWIRWTPNENQITLPDRPAHEFRVTVRDAKGAALSRSFFLDVERTWSNQSPKIMGQIPDGAVVGQAYEGQLSSHDEDGDLMVWSLEKAPTGMTIDAEGLLRWQPERNQIGAHEVIVRVSDVYGGWDERSFAIQVRGTNSPAIIDGDPPPKHRRGTLYATTFTATDADADPVRFRLVKGPSQAILHETSGALQWLPTENGTYSFQVAAIDRWGQGSSIEFEVVVDSVGANLPPRFDSFDIGTAEVGKTYARQFGAQDPEGDALQYRVVEGPTGMSIDGNGHVQWMPLPSDAGRTVAVHLQAIDTLGQVGDARFYLPVQAANHPPVFTSTPWLEVTAGNTYRWDVVARDEDRDPLTLHLEQAPNGLELDPRTGRITWPTKISDIGPHTIEVSVTDHRVDQPVVLRWVLEVRPDRESPKIQVDLSSNQVLLGETITFKLHGIDDVGIVDKSLLIDGKILSWSSQDLIDIIASEVGRHTAVAKVRDAAGNEATTSMEWMVRDPNNAAPRMEIHQPTGEQTLKGLYPVIASIRDADSDLVRVQLEIKTSDGNDPWRTINLMQASPDATLGDLERAEVGVIDCTNLRNGPYALRLIAEDRAFNITTQKLGFVIDGKLKLGNFQVTFTDLSIPVAGIPIEITRVYDSFEADRKGDFGYGWKLEIAKAELQVVEETLGGMGSGRFRSFVDGTRVLVKLPDGTTEGFTFVAEPGTQVFGMALDWRPAFQPDLGNTTRLTVERRVLIKLNDEYLTPEGITYHPQDPQIDATYQLKSPGGLIHNLPARTGKTASLQDRNENVLRFREDGMETSRGRNIVFERDAEGRIRKIIDPRGNAMEYFYDDHGDLVAVTDREGNRISYRYHQDFPHFLDQVVDPFGVPALKAEYRPNDKRLSRVLDAEEQGSSLQYDLSTYTVANKTLAGATESRQFDEEGNPLREVDIHGIESRFQYDQPKMGQPTRLQTIHGAPDGDSQGDDWVTTITYNEFGQVASVRDPRGNVSRHQYDREGNLLSQVDPNGVATYYRYDEKQNLISVKGSTGSAIQIDYDAAGNPTQIVTAMSSGLSGDFGGNGGHRQGSGNSGSGNSGSGNSGIARGITTQFAFNSFGDVVSVIDHDGNQQTRQFDANGNEVESRLKWIDPARPQEQPWIVESQELDGNDQVSKRMAVTGQIRALMDALQREVEQTDANGLKQDTLYDRRGLVIQTRKQAYRFQEDGNSELIWMVERTLFDERGLPAYTLDSTREGTPAGQQTGQRYSYDPQGRMVKVERLRGLDIAIEGSAGQWKSVLKATGAVIDATRSEFDERNRVVKSWDFFGSLTETTYDPWDQVIETRSWVRDEFDQMQWQTSRTIHDSVGRVVWQSKPYLTSFTTVAGVSRSGPTMAEHLEYDKQGRVARRYQVSGVIWVWNSNGYAIENPGTILRSETLTYDDAGKLIQKSFDDGTLEEYQYDARGRLVAVMNQPVPASLVGWDTLYPGQWVRSRTETVYDRNSRVQSTITGVVQVVDSKGKPITIDRSKQRIQSWEYDALGRVVRQIETDGSSTRKEYDPQGRVLAEIDARGRRTEMQYDGRGQMTAIVLPEVTLSNDSTLAKPRWEYEYDGLGNLVAIHANLAQRSTGVIQRDHDGVPGDDTRTTRWIYDDVGHLVERILPSGDRERFTYDQRGREWIRFTLQGTVERSIYDDRPGSSGRLVTKEYFANETSYRSGMGQPEQRVRYRYDARGRLHELQAEQWSTISNDWDLQSFQRWQYDAEGRVIEETSPMGSLYHRYDSIGRRVQLMAGTAATEAENVLHPLLDIRYEYDLLGRLGIVETRVRDGKTVDGDSVQAGDQPERTVYLYDDLGRVRRIELPNHLVELIAYDNRDRVTSVEHLQRRRVGTTDTAEQIDRFEYRYREDGKRIQAIETFAYDHDDNAATPRVLRSSTTQWNYDDLGRLIEERVDDSDDRMDRTETIRWDMVGNRIEKRIDYVQASHVDEAIRSLYDGQDRLLSESIDRGMNGSVEQTVRYQWDKTQLVGKQVFQGVASEPSAWRARQTWSYDVRGLLKSSDVDNGSGSHRTRTEWSYDPMGNRQSMMQWEDRDANQVLSETEKLGVQRWWVDRKNPTGHPQEILEQVESADGRIVQWVTTVFGLDETSQTKSTWDSEADQALSTETRIFLHDARGSVRRIMGALASANESYDFGAFGDLVRVSDSQGNADAERAGRGNQALEGIESEAWTTQLYAGESFEPTLGWQYLRARWMDPLTGRMSQLDPVIGDRSDPLSFHKYAYTHGDPILHNDPTGKFEGLIGMMANIGIRMAIQSAMFEIAKTLHMQWNQPIKPIPAQQIARDWVYGKLASGSYIAAVNNGEMKDLLNVYGFDRIGEKINDRIGYRSVLFKNELSQEIVLSFAGTDDFPDVITDVWQGLLGGSEQYRIAVETYQNYSLQNRTPQHVVGHSLGGGLASTVSIVYGVKGTTFNGAGVHPNTVGLHNKTLDGANALINAYRVRGEFLSTLQDASPLWLVLAMTASWKSPLGLMGLSGFFMPDGVGEAFWLRETSADMFTRHKMTDVFAGMRKA